MPLPSVVFDPLNTVIAQKTYVKITPVGASPVIVNLITNEITYEQSMEFQKREVVASDGLIRADRVVPTKQSEAFKVTLEDIKAAIAIFAGPSLAGVVQASAVEIWITDPQDASGKSAFHVQPFAATITLDGNVTMKGTEFAKGTLKIEAKVKTVWDKDFTIV